MSPTYDLPITSSDALPLSYRRLVGAKAMALFLNTMGVIKLENLHFITGKKSQSVKTSLGFLRKGGTINWPPGSIFVTATRKYSI